MKVVITGSTGMVGQGVLLACLASHQVESVLVINRSPIDLSHPKLTEIIHSDLTDFSSLSPLFRDIDACFFCLGVSSFRMSEPDFSRVSYDITLAFAQTLYQVAPHAVFNYVSGSGTDSSESGKVMWARVKGRVENMLLGMGFKDAYAFRPGAIRPVNGVKSKTPVYALAIKLLSPIMPIIHLFSPIVTSDEVGRAMINSVLFPQDLKHLENRDLIALAHR